jgi:putative regulator of septum formation
MSYPQGPGPTPPYPPPPGGGYPPQYPGPYPPNPYSAPYPSGPYPPPAYGWPPQSQTTSGFAIASLAFGAVGGILLSVIFGVIALGKTKPGGQRGRGLAIGGLVLSGVWAVGIAVAIVVVALLPTHTVSARDIKAGDCFAELPKGARISSVDTISCDRPHVAEVAGVVTIPDGPYPGDSGFGAYGKQCKDSLASYSPTAVLDPDVDLAIMPPTQDSWQRGDREMVCVATFTNKRTGSIKS